MSAETLLTLRLKTSRFLDGKCTSQVGSVYVRPVYFQVRSVSVAGLSGGGVLVPNHDKTGSVTDKSYRSTTTQFPGGQSHSLDAESWRVGELSNMFDIMPIRRDKPGNYNRL